MLLGEVSGVKTGEKIPLLTVTYARENNLL